MKKIDKGAHITDQRVQKPERKMKTIDWRVPKLERKVKKID